MECPECDGENLAEIKQCGTCGAKAPQQPEAGSEGSAKSRYCKICYRTEAGHDAAREEHGWTHDAEWADEFDMALNRDIYALRNSPNDGSERQQEAGKL